MDFISGFFKLVTFGIGVKAETDVWNSHSDDFKNTMILQLFFGLILGFVAWYFYMRNPVGSVNSTLPILIVLDYACVCLFLNSVRNLQEKPFMSQNFSEFHLFGFCKGDDYMGNVIGGAIGALALTYCIFSVTVLHQSIPISFKGFTPPAPQVVRDNYVTPVTKSNPHHITRTVIASHGSHHAAIAHAAKIGHAARHAVSAHTATTASFKHHETNAQPANATTVSVADASN
ncbi:MAG TPA: hypothetical protein V6C76_09680 [Drouetiella sp.]